MIYRMIVTSRLVDWLVRQAFKVRGEQLRLVGIDALLAPASDASEAKSERE